MSVRYPGGFINRSAPVIVGPTNGEGGSAPGVWTLEQASYYTKQGTWPQPQVVGSMWLAGYSNYGQLGQNNKINRSSPVQLGSQTDWTKTSCGNYSISAINISGALWSWGENDRGQLGQNDRIHRSSPVQVGSLTTWFSSSNAIGNGSFTAAIKKENSLWIFGKNENGQLGLGDVVYRSSPVQVGTENNWSKVGSGSYFAIAIKTDNSLWSWGGYFYGSLGLNNDSISRSSPVQVGSQTDWSKISCGYLHAIAIKTDKSLWAWGGNNKGQLGIESILNKSSPTQVGALTTWLNVSCGEYFTIAIKTDGTMWGWGLNYRGELGQNNLIYRSSPVQIGSETSWSKVSCGSYNSGAIKSDGTLWTWGRNTAGALGLNDTTFRSSPTQVGSLGGWQNLSTGSFFFSAIR